MTICQWQPPTGSSMGGVCPACGHHILCHVGVKQCTICYQVALAAAWRTAITGFEQKLRQMADTIRDQAWPST